MRLVLAIALVAGGLSLDPEAQPKLDLCHHGPGVVGSKVVVADDKTKRLEVEIGEGEDACRYVVRIPDVDGATSVMLPRVGWETAVAFVDGDTDRPIVAQPLRGRSPSGETITAGAVKAVVVGEGKDQRGRVQVRLPAIEDQRSTTAWASVGSEFGKTPGGRQWLPEVGDEVIVGFQSGNVAQPVVIGALWSSTPAPPTRGS